MEFVDKIEIAGTKRRTGTGELIVDSRVARTGVQIYAGHEVGKPELQTVRVFRSADEVFSDETLKSFAHRPVTNDHPAEPVTADNWKKHAVGHTADEVIAEQRFIRVPMMVSDAATIADIESGKREWSAGYSCDLDWTPGLTASGEVYDARQINIRANHVALVRRGRGGPELRVGDSWGATPINTMMKDHAMQTLLIDGLPVQVEDSAAPLVKSLLGKITSMVVDHTAAIAAKDGTIGELTAKLADAEKRAAVDVAKLVADRAALLSTAAAIVKDADLSALSDAEIRRKVVSAKFGADVIKDASDDHVAGMFRVAVASSGTKDSGDPLQHAFTGDAKPMIQHNGQTFDAAAAITARDAAWKKMLSDDTSAWSAKN